MSTYLKNEDEVVPLMIFFARSDVILYRIFRHPNSSLLNVSSYKFCINRFI